MEWSTSTKAGFFMLRNWNLNKKIWDKHRFQLLVTFLVKCATLFWTHNRRKRRWILVKTSFRDVSYRQCFHNILLCGKSKLPKAMFVAVVNRLTQIVWQFANTSKCLQSKALKMLLKQLLDRVGSIRTCFGAFLNKTRHTMRAKLINISLREMETGPWNRLSRIRTSYNVLMIDSRTKE